MKHIKIFFSDGNEISITGENLLVNGDLGYPLFTVIDITDNGDVKKGQFNSSYVSHIIYNLEITK